MSYGFRIKNNSGQVVVSDQTYNLAYLGKATFGAVTYTLGDFFFEFDNSMPKVRELRYTIDSGGAPIVPFLYNPNSGRERNRAAFGAIANMSLSGTVWTIYVYMDNVASYTIPTVYCFRRLTPAPLTGYGLAVFDSAGNQTYNTNANHIALRGFTDAQYVDPAPWCGFVSGYAGCRVDTTDYLNPAGASGLVKPAISFGVQYSPLGNQRDDGRQYYFDILAYYNTATNNIHTRWGLLAVPRQSTRFSFNPGPGSVSTLVIDGATYD